MRYKGIPDTLREDTRTGRQDASQDIVLMTSGVRSGVIGIGSILRSKNDGMSCCLSRVIKHEPRPVTTGSVSECIADST